MAPFIAPSFCPVSRRGGHTTHRIDHPSLCTHALSNCLRLSALPTVLPARCHDPLPTPGQEEEGNDDIPNTSRSDKNFTRGIVAEGGQKHDMASLNHNFQSCLGTAAEDHILESGDQRAEQTRPGTPSADDDPFSGPLIPRNLFGTSRLRGLPRPFEDIDSPKRDPEALLVRNKTIRTISTREDIDFQVSDAQDPPTSRFLVPRPDTQLVGLLDSLSLNTLGFGIIAPTVNDKKYPSLKKPASSPLPPLESIGKDGSPQSSDRALPRQEDGEWSINKDSINNNRSASGISQTDTFDNTWLPSEDWATFRKENSGFSTTKNEKEDGRVLRGRNVTRKSGSTRSNPQDEFILQGRGSKPDSSDTKSGEQDKLGFRVRRPMRRSSITSPVRLRKGRFEFWNEVPEFKIFEDQTATEDAEEQVDGEDDDEAKEARALRVLSTY